MAEKTEKATPKKLKDARKKGQVAKAQDFPSAFTFVVSISGLIASMSFLFEQIGTFTTWMFREIKTPSDEILTKIPAYFAQALQVILISSLPLMIIVTFVGMLASFLIVGPVFSFQAMKFDFKRLNPVEGIKQKFKLKVLIELIKSIAKITGAAIIIYLVIWEKLPQIITSVALPLVASASIVNDFLLTVAIRVGIFFLVIALFDLAFQKKNFAKEMKMEKFEVKQEYKDTEGDPLIKSKRRQQFQEIAYQEGPRAARRARAIITNPTHIAVALKYNPEEEPAPLILTMGIGTMAEQIIKIGLENKIPIMRNVELARQLFATGTIADYIPEDTYEAVSEILKWVKSLEENPDINEELLK